MNIYSFSPFGYEGSLVSVEVDVRRGIPAVDIVGLADGAVKESRERMRSAIRNSGFEFPPERVLISLSPADVKKEGAGFDLAIALAVLQARTEPDGAESTQKDGILVMGELELSGQVRAVRGIHAALSTAAGMGIHRCIIPSANKSEAEGVVGMRVFGAESLTRALEALTSGGMFSEPRDQERTSDGVAFGTIREDDELSLVTGQDALIRAMQVAAAGGHNLLAFGPPGCGKTLALQKMGALMPLLTAQEAQSVTRIHSIAGLLPKDTSLLRTAPFRQPHQSASMEGMCGGGVKCLPGEISLAHNGVLFLDEALEFRSSVLQMMRIPLETGTITLSRAGRTTTYPAAFQLVMAANPCPCGFFGSKEKLCLCSSHAIEQYWGKLSGPLLDRMDIRVRVEKSGARKTDVKAQTTEELRRPVARAVAMQRKRQDMRNARLPPHLIESVCARSAEAQAYLDGAAEKLGLSFRAKASCIKIARTVADMEGMETIGLTHMQEAVSLRKTGTGLDEEFAL